MKRKKINRQVPTYKFGLDQVGALANIAGTTLQGTGNETMGTIGGTLSGAASGLAVGGPIGAVVGGVTGLASGLLGNAAKKRAIATANRKKGQQINFNSALANTAEMQQEYNEENPLAYTFANGGIMPTNLAYVDDGEVIRYPNGNTVNVPEQGQQTDQNLVNLPQNSAILSDKLKLKQLGGKTPAEYYKQKAAKVSYGTDQFAENSAKLNKQNNDNLYRNLLSMQAQENKLKGNKIGTKNIPTYANGKIPYAPEPYQIPLTNWGNTVTATMPKPTGVITDAVKASPISTINTLPIDNTSATSSTDNNFFSNLNFGSLASLTPVAYNLAQSFKQPELEESIQNPYTNDITSTMSRRRYNINPTLQANARARAVNNYNLSQVSPNTGMSMAARVQNALGQYSANADLYGVQQNYNNQYMSDYANVLNNLGQQSVQAQTTAATQNRVAKTAREAFAGTAASQFGQWAQTQQQMANQRANDRAVLPALQKFLSAGYTSNELQNIMSLLNR